MRMRCLLGVGLILVAVPLLAHDFWLAGARWHVASGAKITITANVGERFPVPTSFTAPERVASLTLIGPKGKVDLTDFRREGNSLASEVQLPPDAATYLIVMTVKPRFIEIQPKDFATYLTHEGLERIVAERNRLGEAAKPGRERYSRFSKLLVRAGDGPSPYVTRPAGLAAELVPLSDPTELRVGDSLALQLLVQGTPVPGALVGAIDAASKGAPDEWPLKARTDRDGRVEFKLAARGPWLIRTVHMVRSTGESGAEAADWQSYWVSLTFDLRQ